MMTEYNIYSNYPNSGFIDVEIKWNLRNYNKRELIVELPNWRPGRYETADFAKNIRELKCLNSKGELLIMSKIEKSKWKVKVDSELFIIIQYRYFANTINAGSSFVSSELFYVNPVNCLMYADDFFSHQLALNIKIPINFQLLISEDATVTKNNNTNNYSIKFNDVHHLYDTPFVAAKNVETIDYKVGNTKFQIGLVGKNNLKKEKLCDDFKRFSNFQVKLFEEFPAERFLFIYLCLPYEFYHGVEHQKNTIVAIGPGNRLAEDELYEEVLGVGSHELFHCWNIKSIRPADMLPYKYNRPNYSKLGYIYEGITTYYGDLVLLRCGIFSIEDYLKQLNLHLNKHFANTGRNYYSVAESSFDTWLDGYTQGIPGRKVSIYTEGCLIAFCIDIFLIYYSNFKFSLDDVCKKMNEQFGHLSKGYREKDFKNILKKYCSKYDWETFFYLYINGKESYKTILQEATTLAGFLFKEYSNGNNIEKYFGIRTEITPDGSLKITEVIAPDYLNSDHFCVGDKIISVNGKKTFFDINQLFETQTQLEFIIQRFFTNSTSKFIINLPFEKRKKINEYFNLELNSNQDSLQKRVMDFWISKR